MSIENRSAMSIKRWLSILVLAISTFTIVTSELAPVGLLTPMAESLNVSKSQIGLTVTIYAWIGALSAILASIFLGSIAKKKLLIILITILFASNILSAISTSYYILLLSRIVGAFAHGSFWAIIGATAVAIVPPRYIGIATSIVFGGVSAASVFGVPLSNYIGIVLSWNDSFWLLSGLSVISLLGIVLLIPPIHTDSAIGISSLKKVFKSLTLWKVYIATLLVITAHFSAFTYIEPWLHTQKPLSVSYIPIALFVFGIAGLLGNVITGITIDKHLKTTVIVSICLISCVLMYLGTNNNIESERTIFVSLALWGLAVSGVFVGLQTWVFKLADKEVFSASAIYVSCFNLAIGLGAILGAWGITKLSYSQLYLFTGIIIGLSIFLIMIIPSEQNK